MNTTDEPEQVGTISLVGLWGWIRQKMFVIGTGSTAGFMIGALLDGIASHPILFGVSFAMVAIGYKPNAIGEARADNASSPQNQTL